MTARRDQRWLASAMVARACSPYVAVTCGSLAGCHPTTAISPAAAPPGNHDAPASQAIDPAGWRRSDWLGTRVPVAAEELDDLSVGSPYIVRVGGRIVWLDLAGADAQLALPRLSGPATIILNAPDPEQVAAVARVASQVPVAVVYRAASLAGTAHLSELGHVQGLELSLDGSVRTFPDLQSLSRLTWAEISVERIYPALLDNLPRGLSDLRLNGPMMNDALSRLRGFQSLTHFATQTRGLDFRGLGDLVSLESLELPDDVKPGDIAAVRKLPRLRALSTDAALPSDALKSVAQLHELRELQIARANASDADVKRLHGLRQLQLLEAPRTLTDAGLRELGNLKQLHTLNLRDTQVGDESASLLAELPALRDLDLAGTRFSDASAPTLAKLTGLQRLSVRGMMLGSGSAHALSRLGQLRRLDLSETAFGDQDTPMLLKLTELRSLSVFYTKIGEANWLRLAQLPKLRAFWVGPGLTHSACARLAALPHLSFFGDLGRARDRAIAKGLGLRSTDCD